MPTSNCPEKMPLAVRHARGSAWKAACFALTISLALILALLPLPLQADAPGLAAVSAPALVTPVTGHYLEGAAAPGERLPAAVTTQEVGIGERILQSISKPDVAYLLMMVGFLGVFFELSTPGVILPGVIGGISLILAFFAFQTLPVDYAGALLIVLAMMLFIAEVKIVSHGMLGIGGTISLLLGSLLLFPSRDPSQRLSWGVLGGTVLVTTLFFLFVVAKVIEAHRQKPITGREGMLGAHGVAETELRPEGKVFIRGEYWNAVGEEPIAKGEKVEVTAVDGLVLTVRKLQGGDEEHGKALGSGVGRKA